MKSELLEAEKTDVATEADVAQLTGTPSPNPAADVVPSASVGIGGIRLDRLTMRDVSRHLIALLESDEPSYVATANVDFLVQARTDLELQQILFDADLVLCDGMPLVWLSRLLGVGLPERVAGSDLMPRLMEICQNYGYRVFLLGGSPGAAKEACEALAIRFPNLEVCGYYTPPYRSLVDMDHREMKARVRAAFPDLVLVGLGCPKQEKWIGMHYRGLGGAVVMGVGASIDFMAGRIKRAPVWMRGAGLEWIHRCAQEPRRLIRRYCRDAFGLMRIALPQWLEKSAIGVPGDPLESPPRVDVRSEWIEIVLPEVLTCWSAEQRRSVHDTIRGHDKLCWLDASRVDQIDSGGIGELMRLQQLCRRRKTVAVLGSPNRPVVASLKASKCLRLFPMADTREEARRRFREEGRGTVLRENPSCRQDVLQLRWHGEVTSENQLEVMKKTLRAWRSAEGTITGITIELDELDYIDSSGLRMLKELKRLGERHGVSVTVAKASDDVKAGIRKSGLIESGERGVFKPKAMGRAG